MENIWLEFNAFSEWNLRFQTPGLMCRRGLDFLLKRSCSHFRKPSQLTAMTTNNTYYYASDSLWKIWLVESIQSIHNSLWTWHDKCKICCRYCIYHVKFNVCLVTKPLEVFLLRNKMAERFASVSEDELCEKYIVTRASNNNFHSKSPTANGLIACLLAFSLTVHVKSTKVQTQLHNVSPLYIMCYTYISHSLLVITVLALVRVSHSNTTVIHFSTRTLARANTLSISLHYVSRKG